MGLFDFNKKQRQQRQQHQDNVAPWEKYARQSDRDQGWYCNHDHDPSECED